ncbi:MAG: NAD(P)/FAD-dependent oxidoreductase [Ruminococcus sp.]
MNNPNKFYNLIIIGAGASGLAMAVTAKRKNKDLSVCILEAGEKPGRKLLATGNGRCNLTNMDLSCEKYYGSFPCESVISKVNPHKLLDFFLSIGLLCKTEENGLVYPYCKQAKAVRDVLLMECNRLGVDIICNSTVFNIKKAKGTFCVKSTSAVFNSEKVALCCGGKASPSCGGTGAGIDLLKNIGIKINTPSPALCPVEVTDTNIKTLKGVRTRAKVSLYDGNRFVKDETGELQFTDNTLSGICIFNLSSVMNKINTPVIKVNFMPDYCTEEVMEIIKNQQKIFWDEPISLLLTGIINGKLGNFLLKSAFGKEKLNNKSKTLNNSDLCAVSDVLCRTEFRCSKSLDFKKAQVMAGGIDKSEVNPNTMESKRVKGFYFCGEILDINGDCGGYNLHFAFASGIIAGENI